VEEQYCIPLHSRTREMYIAVIISQDQLSDNLHLGKDWENMQKVMLVDPIFLSLQIAI